MTLSLPDLRAFWIGVGLHLWQCSLVLLVLLAAARLLRRASGRSLRLFWTAGLLKLCLPLALLGPAASAALHWLVPRATGEPGGVWRAVLTPPVLVVDPASIPAPLVRDPWFYLTVLWLAGSLTLASTWLARARKARVDLPAAPEGAVDRRLAAAVEGTGVALHDVIVTSDATGPRVVGLLRRRIVLPDLLLARFDVEELRSILLHEEAHRRRRDPWLALFARLALIVFYYYPPLWLVLRRLGAATEITCDDEVLASGIDTGTYSRALARAISLCSNPETGLPAAAGSSPSSLCERFERITDPRRYVTMPRHKLLLSASVALVAAASVLPVTSGTGSGAFAGDLAFVELNRLRAKDLPVMAKFHDVEPAKLFEALAAVGPLHLKIEGQLPSAPVSYETGRVPLAQALRALAEKTGVRYRVPDPDTLVVIARRTTAEVPMSWPGPLEVSEQNGVSPPTLIEKAQPAYPKDAQRARLGGNVILQAVIGVDGLVKDIQVLQAAPAGMGFEEASLEAVKQWRYQPALQNGEPVEVYFTIVIEFTLRDSDPASPQAPAD